MIELRDYQTSLIGEVRDSFRHGAKSVCMQAPTGAGKTVIATSMASGAICRSMRVWFVVHRRELLSQASEAFRICGIDHGFIASGRDESDHLAKVCSIQTLARRFIPESDRPDLVIWDECHHSASASWSRVKSGLNAKHIGITATPCRLDGKGLAQHFDKLVIGPSVRSLIDRGALSGYRLYAPPSSVDMSSVRSSYGDWARGQAEAIVCRPSITGSAVEHYSNLAPDSRAIAFCVSVKHADAVADAFNKAGVSATSVSGKTTKRDRDAAVESFRSGDTRILTNCDLFSEGFNVPGAETAILLRPTQSLSMYLQQVGRVLRPKGRKAIILDHVGNCQRHGLPDEDREWTLDGIDRGRTREASASVRICGECFSAQPSGTGKCPYCGYEHLVQEKLPAQKSGTLEEVTRIKRQARREQGLASTLDQLVEIGKRKGYRNPRIWAQHVLNGRRRKRGGF